MVLLIALTLVGRVVTSGQSALSEGHQALKANNELRAVVAYREAVSWYLPGIAPWRSEAADALWALHTRQLEEGRLSAAVQSLQSLRAGLRSADSLWRPDKALKAKVDTTLATLMAKWEAADARESGRESPGPLEARSAHHAALLAQDERPSRGFGFLAVVGFGLWVGCAIRALSERSEQPKRLFIISAAGFIAFITGLALA